MLFQISNVDRLRRSGGNYPRRLTEISNVPEVSRLAHELAQAVTGAVRFNAGQRHVRDQRVDLSTGFDRCGCTRTKQDALQTMAICREWSVPVLSRDRPSYAFKIEITKRAVFRALELATIRGVR